MILKKYSMNNSTSVNSPETSVLNKFHYFQKMQNENVLLLKSYQSRLKRALDDRTRMNLKLEFERRLAENAVLAKTKYDMAVKQLQKERAQMMEKAMKNLFEDGQHLTEKDKEKHDLYMSVLQFAKTETWPCTWILNSFDLSDSEAAEKVFYKIIRCPEHPLSQWLMLMQMNVRRDVGKLFNQYSEYLPFLPGCLKNNIWEYIVTEENKELTIRSSVTEKVCRLPSAKMIPFRRNLQNISSDISNAIGNALQIFYLIYKSLLPEDSETVCYSIIEKHFLEPIWYKLLTLFRISNLQSESKLAEVMSRPASSASDFEIPSADLSNGLFSQAAFLLETIPKYSSIMEKLKILVQISQILCSSSIQDAEAKAKKYCGAEELISRLCQLIIISKMPQLISECQTLEQLFDMKYMLGEEGYTLSSFLTALKYIEIKELTECSNSSNTAEN